MLSKIGQRHLLRAIQSLRRASAKFEGWPDEPPDGASDDEVRRHEEIAQELAHLECNAEYYLARALPLGRECQPRAVVLADGSIVVHIDSGHGVAIIPPDRVEQIEGGAYEPQ